MLSKKGLLIGSGNRVLIGNSYVLGRNPVYSLSAPLPSASVMRQCISNFMIAREVFYEGRVQGVGFRYSVKELAKGYDIAGWVMNLPDGRVHLTVQGDEAEVKEFLGAILKSHLRAHIVRHVIRNSPVITGLKGFEIRHCPPGASE